MFNFSSKTIVNKEYKVSDFLTQIKASKEVRADAKKIKSIVFKNVISAETLNATFDKQYQNIYVIYLVLNERTVPKLFIEELDKNIAFHTYFVFEYNKETASMIAFKEIGNKVKISSNYYISSFKEQQLVSIPMINSVKDMYTFILSHEIKILSREDESPSEYMRRVKAINRLNFQISKTEKAIIYETQPKKKFEYNERLRRYKRELDELMRMER
jgi:competence CoiA-like predicted nuclease